jgi:hypothetical protein
MENFIEVFEGSNNFANYLESYSKKQKKVPDLGSREVSKAIFFHLIKMKLALINHKKSANRRIKATFSETFQDLLAFYLEVCLPDNFTVEQETRQGKLQPDILIKKDSKNHFILEIKTTIGWSRNQVTPPFDDTNPLVARITELASTFDISKDNILYIFENPFNVRKEFEAKYWDSSNGNWKPQNPAPSDFPFSQIKPLFAGTNPEHWPNQTEETFKDHSILKIAEGEIATPFESILSKIIA